MSCRSTPANSAATTFARLNSDLNDVQTLSAFHLLRAEAGQTAEPPTRRDWMEHIAAERALIEWHPNLTDARRRSLLRRLDEAAKQPLPDGPTWAALRRIRGHTQTQSRELANRYQALADRLNTDLDTVRRRAAELAAEVDTRRDAPAPPGYTPVGLRSFREARLPLDRQTVYALTRLEQEAAATANRRQPRTVDNRRIIRQAIDSSMARELGYDPDGGRLEIVFHTNPDRVYSYRNVPAEVYQEMLTGSVGRVYHEHIRNNPRVRYPNAAEGEADGFRTQCTGCGQFTGSGHACPTRLRPTTPRPTDRPATPINRRRLRHRQMQARSLADITRRAVPDPISGVVTVLPEVPVLTQETRTGPVSLPVLHFGDRREDHGGTDHYSLDGSITIVRDDDGTLGVDLSTVRCNCADYQRNGRCPHVDTYGRAALRRINPDRASEADVRDAQAAVKEALTQDWMRSARYAEEARRRWARGSEVLYSENPEAFEAAAAAARDRRQSGEAALVYMTEDATDGMLTRESGRGFGLEIEFDLPDLDEEDRNAALRAIGLDLHAAGLTTHAHQRDYHSARSEGYTDSHAGGWAYEEDGSVAGEIVSPIMYDEPETWANIATVCAIVKKHGGEATVSTGSHVHVGAASYDHDIANHTEVTRLVNQYEDVIYRLAQNPDDPYGEHRPLGYCAPNPEVPLSGYQEVRQAAIDHHGHNRGLNLQAVRGDTTDHIEFRHWDATLNPAMIQAQVKMSAALTVAAQRIASEYGTTARPREPLGSHRNRNHDLLGNSRRRLTDEEQAADTATARSFIDTLFTRREDKAQIAGLFGITRWQRRTPYRGYTAMADDGAFDAGDPEDRPHWD